jgi:hypothetical protein
MKKAISFIFLLLVVFIFIGCDNIDYKARPVNGTVVDKDYHSMYTTVVPIRSGKTTIMAPQVHPARYIVYISYNGMSCDINDRATYNKYNIGDQIPIYLYEGYDDEGKLHSHISAYMKD